MNRINMKKNAAAALPHAFIAAIKTGSYTSIGGEFWQQNA